MSFILPTEVSGIPFSAWGEYLTLLTLDTGVEGEAEAKHIPSSSAGDTGLVLVKAFVASFKEFVSPKRFHLLAQS